MCGILGFSFKENSNKFNKIKFDELLELIKHRGPDSTGIFKKDTFIFGMNRLSIIDASNGDQPMSSSDDRYKIIFNGEVYNFRELKSGLQNLGVKFKTNSDTEVVLNLYIKYGPSCLAKINGMFAFAIYDLKLHELFIARDRFGKKPLYYLHDNYSFGFSSEIKPLIQSNLINNNINNSSIIDLLSLWYISEPKTIIKSILQLPPGHYMKLKNHTKQITKWYDIETGKLDLKFNQASEYLENLLKDSIKIRLTSDVKVATMISGGIDSGLVSSIYSSNYTSGDAFTIDFKEKSYSEYNLAKKNAEKFNLKLHKVDYINSRDNITEILEKIDEPLGNASLVASYQIFNFIKKNNIKVVLTGDGGDELFGGYPTYQSEYYHKLFKLVPRGLLSILRKIVNSIPVSHKRISFDYKLKKLLRYIHLNPLIAHPHWREAYNYKDLFELLKENLKTDKENYNPFNGYYDSYKKSKNLDIKNRLMLADFENYLLNDHLRKIDRSSMLNSVEARCPFLDHRIVEFAYSISSNYKVDFISLKKILKDISKKHLNTETINSSKKGLTPPINYWITDFFREYLKDNIRTSGSFLNSYFKNSNLENIVDLHLNKKIDYSRFLWSLISLNFWYDNNKKYISI